MSKKPNRKWTLDREWAIHWFYDLVPIETIRANKFSEWMWCPERYNDEDLEYLSGLWHKRRLQDYHGNMIPDSMLGVS